MSDSYEEYLADAANALAFSEVKQEAVLGYILTDNNFFLGVMPHLKDVQFSNVIHGRIYKEKLAFYKKYGSYATIVELKESPNVYCEPAGFQMKFRLGIDMALARLPEFQFEPLVSEIDDWIKSTIFRHGILEGISSYKAKNLPNAIKIATTLGRALTSSSLNKEIEFTLKDYRKIFEQAVEIESRGLTCGLSALDKLLAPTVQGGCLVPGEMSLWLGPSNVGKSTVLCSIAVANLIQGRSVLYITHEGRPTDIYQKIWQNIMQMEREMLMANWRTPATQALMDGIAGMLDHQFKYVPMGSPGLTAQEVVSRIELLQEQRRSMHGSGYDLVIDDYPGCLEFEGASKFELRHKLRAIYNLFSQVAEAQQFHAAVAYQTNREGSKVNKGALGKAERLLTMEDASEAWGPCEKAQTIVTINRSPSDQAAKRMILFVSKSRSSQTDYAMVCRTNFACSISHSDNLEHAWYQGNVIIAQQLDELVKQHTRGQIPPARVFASS